MSSDGTVGESYLVIRNRCKGIGASWSEYDDPQIIGRDITDPW